MRFFEKIARYIKMEYQKIKSMKRLFYGCSSLIELPDISKWTPNNVIDLGNLFLDAKA